MAVSTAKDVREAAGTEPGFGTLAGPLDTGVKDRGGEAALNGMDVSCACRRLIEVM